MNHKIKIKIRFHTWYWGKYIFSGQYMEATRVTEKSEGFEIYNEEKHGWHNSEEYKKGISQYDKTVTC